LQVLLYEDCVGVGWFVLREVLEPEGHAPLMRFSLFQTTSVFFCEMIDSDLFALGFEVSWTLRAASMDRGLLVRKWRIYIIQIVDVDGYVGIVVVVQVDI
jgi:hypothetical protein